MTRNDEFYGEDIKNISRVDFTLYTNKDVKLYSAVRNDPLGITVPESYDNYEPKKGGLVDLRLGTCDIYLPCSTCGLNSEECPGHFGHTELAEPAFHYGFFGHVKNLLQTICLRCSNILIEKDEKLIKRVASKDLKHRFMEIKNLTKGVKFCYTCGAPVPVVKKEIKEKAATVKIILERDMGMLPEDAQTEESKLDPKKKLREYLSPRDVYNILKNVSDTDAHLIGFNTKYSRPEDLILTRFPIPPVVIRPTARIDFMSSSTMEDSLTLFIAGIISNNNRVRKQLEKEAMEGDQSTYKQDVATLVQYNIATYFDNETITLPRSEFKTGGKPLKSIKDRISAKTGRVRGNLMGKRVDFSGRTVITSDPNIDIDQVGVPLKIAMELTFPEEVTPTNIKYLTALVKNGRDKYPGANYVIRTVMINGEKVAQKIDLKYRKKDIKLKYGDVVERHMLNDDYVLFNRQPSLHKPSMMGHKAHILNRDDVNTFRVNVSVTQPYNADFDGDEMNIFLAQSIQSKNELARICNSKFQIIHAKDSKPIIGCKQDAVSGAYMMSVLNDKLDEELKNQLIATTSAIHNYKSDNKDDGLSLFSKIIPEGINSTKFKDDGSIDFQIKNGNLMKGVLDKSQLSTAKNSIIHFIWDKYGADLAQKFIDDTQRIVLQYLMYHGQTIGFGDTIINDKARDHILNMLKQNDLKIRSQITQYENDVDKLSKSIIEELILAELSSIGPNISSLVYKELDNNNFLYVLVNSGAKGNKTNVQQMMGCLGQQVVEGKRIQPKLNNRTLPYFHQFDDTPDARGFCKNNFLTGLESYEMFFHTMGGREGLIDTAIKSVTWETEIIVLENDKPKKIEIGKWIDTILEENVNLVEHYKDRDMELLELGKINNKSYIPTTDMDGNVSWGVISAITRHDPGIQLYQIKTHSGRDVIVTESKSLLIWDSNLNKLVDTLTPEIKIGDYVPITCNLTEPPKIINEIDLSLYLSKTEYIYGSEYNKAIKLMNENMENRNKIKANWWKNNNNNNFTLPYTKKSLLQRSIIRNNNNVKDGYIYPYNGFRNDTLIKDKLKLDYDNGLFIGLYLAEGSIEKYCLRISNNNININNFVEKWFIDNNIKYNKEDRTNNIGGRSMSIRANSVILCKIFETLFGKGAENKKIPDIFYFAPIEFIKGLINGYISGDGCITKNSIVVTSCSQKLIKSISFLCNRLNIYGRISLYQHKTNNLGTKNIKPTYKYTIASKWANRFSEIINLIEENKNTKLKSKKWSNKHLLYNDYNDVVLDKIIEINLIDVKLHPKVYDLTIPSTLNFGLANGLQVRDTAKTGYIQRKLIKGMEDMNVTYDSTVRGANGVIVQFTYGDSGIDQARQTEVKIRLISSNNKQVETNYLFNKQQLDMLKKKYKKDYSEMNKKLLKELLERRDLIRRAFQVNMLDYKYMENKYMLPVNLYRLTQEYNNLRDKKTDGDIDPNYVIDQIEHLLNSSDIRIFNYNNDFFKEDELNYKYLFKTALLDYLSPKMVLFDMQLNKSEFDNMLNDIKKSFLKALVEPGEMVGIVAAQSIGEPTSQMTLNTKHSAGVAGKGSANMGVGRVEELIHYAKSISTPLMYVYFKNNKFDESKVKHIASNLNYLNLNMLIEDAEIILDMGDDTYYGKQLKDDNVSIPFFINNTKAPLETLPFVIRLKLDLEKILDKETDMLDIKTKFLSFWTLNYSNTKSIREKDVKDTIKEINKLAILSNGVDVIHIRFSLNNFDYVLLNKFLNIVLNNISLKGVDSIDNVEIENIIYSYSDEEGNVKQDKEFRLITSGINFEHILKIKDIDTDRTICNDVHYVYQHYGIEAARNIIFSELNNVFKSDVNQAHINVLVDTMTHLGHIISIDRHGVPKLESEVMAKAAFEMTMDHFVNAAMFNEKDHINSVSSRIMTGRVVKGGTGCFDLLMDTSKLEQSELTKDEYGGRVEIEKLELDPVFESMF
jgi:DNA-directed RNA polymerase beta' subunit